MKNRLKYWSAFLLLIFASCTSEDVSEPGAEEVFVTSDLSFLAREMPEGAAKGWPVNGCKEFTVRVKIPLIGDVSTKILHCCVNMACAPMPLLEIVDYVIGDKSGRAPAQIEVVSSKSIIFNEYEIRVNPGTYPLDEKTGGVLGLQYEVRVRR